MSEDWTEEQMKMVKEDFSKATIKENGNIVIPSCQGDMKVGKLLKEDTEDKINFLNEKYIDNWKVVKGYTINRIKESDKLTFFSHTQDSIKGKPQLIHQTLQKIPVLREIVSKNKEGIEEIKYKFIDDRYDKRYDGYQKQVLSFEFWVYRLVEEGKEYYIFSQKQLPNEVSIFKGMKIELEDLSELSKNMKLKSISTIFILYEHFSSVQILSPDNLIRVTKHLKEKMEFGAEEFKDLIFTHPDGNVYDYSEDFNLLRISQLLSGTYEGYPLHIKKIGSPGTGKTYEQECLQLLFDEEQGILEGGSSTPKVLEPSFKEKPANIGYIAKCNRFAMIDELYKMVQNQMARHDVSITNNHLGTLNFLLEHKKRMVGSGNDNSVVVQATAKISITTNPLSGKNNIYQHYGIIDPSTLSRMLIWVQDSEEQEKIRSKSGIKSSPATITRLKHSGGRRMIRIEIVLGGERGEREIDTILTIYDTCQTFLCKYDVERLKKIVNATANIIREPFRNDVFRPRALHHAVLVLDGLCKYRCLFKDYDESFESKDEDYKNLERIFIHMVNGWESDLIAKSYGGILK